VSIFIYRNNQQLGPLEHEAVYHGLADGQFSPDDLAWKEGCVDWTPLRTLIEIPSECGKAWSAAVLTTLEQKTETAESAISRLCGDEQDASVVQKVVNKARELLTKDETVEYIAIQRKPLVTILPEAILLTNKRFMIVRPKMMAMTFEDHPWREVSNVHMSEQMLGATITFTTVRGGKLEIDSLPKKQARRIYSYAQEVEERMHDERRNRDLEEKRASAGGVFIQSPPSTSAQQTEDPVQALATLKRMLEAGLIEQSEYDAKKREILSRM
jgi:ribosomal protein S19